MRPQVTKQYEDWQDYIRAALTWLNQPEKNNARTKLGYAMMRVDKELKSALKPLQEKFAEDLEDLNIATCEVDQQGCIAKDPVNERFIFNFKRGQSFTDRNTKARELHKALRSTPITISAYYATEIPPDLTPFELEIFSGVVIDPAKFNEMCALYEAPEADSTSDSIS